MAVAADEPTDAKDALDLPLVWSAEGDGFCMSDLLRRTDPDRIAVYVFSTFGTSRTPDTPQIGTFDLATGRSTQTPVLKDDPFWKKEPFLNGLTTFGIAVASEEHSRYFVDPPYRAGSGGVRTLVAFDLDAGKERWRAPLPDATTIYQPFYASHISSPFMQDGRVLAGTMAFDAATGKRLWSVKTRARAALPIELAYPVACGKRQAFYYLLRKESRFASLAVVDLATGTINHEEPLRHFIEKAMLTGDERQIFLQGYNERGCINCVGISYDDIFDTKTWARRSMIDTYPQIVAGNLLIAHLSSASTTRRLADLSRAVDNIFTDLGAFDAATGRIVWQHTDNVDNKLSDWVVGETGGVLIVRQSKQGDPHTYLYGARGDDGTILWKTTLLDDAHAGLQFVHYSVVGPDRLVQMIQWKPNGSDTFRHRLRCYKLLPPSQAAPHISTAVPALASLSPP